MFITPDEIELLQEALLRAANRHEREGRATSVIETAKRHATTARAMRALRSKIIAKMEAKDFTEMLLRT